MSKRIYRVVVKESHAENLHLVRADHRAQAVSHVARNMMVVRVATQDDIIDGFEAGTKIEDAGADTVTEGEQA